MRSGGRPFQQWILCVPNDSPVIINFVNFFQYYLFYNLMYFFYNLPFSVASHLLLACRSHTNRALITGWPITFCFYVFDRRFLRVLLFWCSLHKWSFDARKFQCFLDLLGPCMRTNVGLMLDQRLRRCPNIKPTLFSSKFQTS